jgi:hypothetical protein
MQLCINVNGIRTPFFNRYQGLRQGDPLSLMMFNLVVEALATLMWKVPTQGKVKGVVSHLIPEGITHIQYVDDSILMVKGNDASITNMKFILYCFEWMSRLKINYHESEAYIFGMGEENKWIISNMLNCQLGELPMRYLGIPLSNSKLGMGALAKIPEKLQKEYLHEKVSIHPLGGRGEIDPD